MRWLIPFVFATPLSAHEIGPEALASLPSADVVILGEVHDNPVHHANQTRAVAAIQPRALVFEMLTEAQAEGYVAGDQAGVEASLAWSWGDFPMYYPIFAAVPEALVFGGDPGRDEVRRAVGEGAAAVFGEGAAQYGLTEAHPQQAAMEAEQQTAHCNALPEDALSGMVEAQRLRDAAFARAVIAAHKAAGGPVVLITGSGHARLDAVPAMLALAAPDLKVLTIGQTEAPQDDAPYDMWLVADPPERDDPCAAFKH